MTDDEIFDQMIESFKAMTCIKYSDGLIRYTTDEIAIKQAIEGAYSTSSEEQHSAP